MRTTLLASLVAVIVALAIAATASAADPVNIQIMAVEEQPGKIVLTVSAVDEKGKPFPGLGATSFNAWINDQPLIVRGLQTETARLPASILLLVDVSGSMAGDPMNQSRAAIQQFIDSLDAQDQVAVMSFASNVQLLQDFTADRDALANAVSRLAPAGETALYDGVIQAAERMAAAPAGRKLIVLLSDGTATIGAGNRARSLQAAQASSVGVVAFGLGSGIDRKYLGELTAATGGRFLEAATPAAIKQAYADLASAIRSQYTLQLDVPRSIDRTGPGRLKVHVIYRADNAFAERDLGPLEGALPPPFSISVKGLKAGAKPSGVVPLLPSVQDGIEVVKLDYYVDDQVIHTADAATPGFDLDTSTLGSGAHVLKIVATDAAGREGEIQVPFVIPEVVASSGGASIPVVPLAILALLAVAAYLVNKYFGKRIQARIQAIVRGGDVYESRVSSWAAIRTPGPVQRPEEWPERPEAAGASAAAQDDVIRGRVVIMDEAAVRNGELDSIREFEMHASPLTFGSGPSVDMRVGDAGGLIAAEEARVWVQRGRLVYHKLTTLSAMATEGVTAGWQFLEDGDEMRIGPYRLIFQAQQQEEVEEEAEPAPDHLPQEHGMALRPTGTDIEGNRGFSSWARDLPPSDDGRPPSLHDFNTPGQDGAARTWGSATQEPSPSAWCAPPASSFSWSESGETSEASLNESSDAEQPQQWPSAAEQDISSWGSAEEESRLTRWGVVEESPPAEEIESEQPGANAWSFSDQSAASEWDADASRSPAGDWDSHEDAAPAAEWSAMNEAGPAGNIHGPAEDASGSDGQRTLQANFEDEASSWKSGEWESEADQEDDEGRA